MLINTAVFCCVDFYTLKESRIYVQLYPVTPTSQGDCIFGLKARISGLKTHILGLKSEGKSDLPCAIRPLSRLAYSLVIIGVCFIGAFQNVRQ